MKLSSVHKYLILILSVFIVLGMSTHMESNNAGADSDPVILLSKYVPATMTPVSIQASRLLENSNSTLNPQGQSLDKPFIAPPTFATERNLTGSIPTFSTIMQAFKSRINTSMIEATTVALDAVGTNTTAISSTLQPDRGFLVYDIRVVDADNQIHSVIIDAGDGKVLSKILLPMIDLVKMRSGPPPVGPPGPAGVPAGGGYAMPPLPPPVPSTGGGYAMPPLPPPVPSTGGGYAMPQPPVNAIPGAGGSVQPIQPQLPAQ
jgi:uncharacterized membrane protein YkoI